jgi:formylglycine-generating enzyme required for sulfatase activity
MLHSTSNWSGGVVGTGYISSGHNDSAPNNALAPDPSDANGNAGETNQTFAQKRTLTLTNGQVIWDLAGNVWEWTAGTVAGGQPGVAGNNYSSWIEWPNVTTNGTLAVNPFPSGTGLSGSNTWNSSKGVGMLISSTTNNGLSGFIRGGAWYIGSLDGVLALDLYNGPGVAGADLGFRVAE